MPLSVREGKREPFKPTVGVPAYFYGTLRQFLQVIGNYLLSHLSTEEFVALEHRLTHELRVAESFTFYKLAQDAYEHDEELFLDLIDLFLFKYGENFDKFPSPIRNIGALEYLDSCLFDVDHEYRIDADKRRLVRRVDETVWAAYERVLSVEDEAAELIGSAWAKQYSRNPDFAGAWEDARKAVEVLLKLVVSPKDKSATISKMARVLRDNPGRFECSLRGTQQESPVLQFAHALDIIGYPPNHHGAGDVDSAQSATVVLQAVTVVGWLRDGALRVIE